MTKPHNKTTVKQRLDKIISQLYGNGAIHNLVDKAKTDHRIVLDIFRNRASLEPKETKQDGVLRVQLELPSQQIEHTPIQVLEVDSTTEEIEQDN